MSLYSCLRSFFAPEQLDGVECVNCTLEAQLKQHAAELENLAAIAQSVPGAVSLQHAQSEACSNLAAVHALTDATRSGCRTASVEDLALCGITDLVRATYSKSFVVSRWPAVLCLHLGRLNYDPHRQAVRKNRVRVHFPLELSSAELRSSVRSLAVCPRQYQLKAVVVHHGGATSGTHTTRISFFPTDPGTRSSGHYTVYIKVDDAAPACGRSKSNETWYHISDETVTVCSIETVLRSEAYMLFYEDRTEVNCMEYDFMSKTSKDEDVGCYDSEGIK